MQRGRGGTRIPRSAPCPCGSGKKYKHCHGNIFGRSTSASAFPDDDEVFRQRFAQVRQQHEAAEKVRREQQGYGRPIISLEHDGTRFVAVKNRLWHPPKGRRWIYFNDFLFDYLKSTLKHEWGARAKRDGLNHPLFRWFDKVQDYSQRVPSENGRPMVGFVAGVLHLGYALYLIAHHDVIPNRLLRRLRDPQYFLPAFYEVIVGAALAVAGFEIENAEKKVSDIAAPEFRAKSQRSGTMYDVEAKRKAGWQAPTGKLESEDFRDELAGYIRDQIHKAAKKKLKIPVLWIELSIPDVHSAVDWQNLIAHVNSIVVGAQTMTVDGEALGPTFVFISNHTFLANEDVDGQPEFLSLHTINVPDFPLGRQADLEELLESYEKYRDVFSMREGWRIARAIPPSFDGTPGEFLQPDGTVIRPIKIGDRVKVPDMEGREVEALVEELASIGDKLAVFVKGDGNETRWMVQMPLTEAEAQAASRYTDAVFGKSNVSRPLREGDPFDLYDWVLNAHAGMTPEQLEKQMEGSQWDAYRGLSTEEKRKAHARRMTLAFWAQGHSTKPPEGDKGGSN